eukprot:jgi/Astpho2/372/Aster-02246
MVAWPSRRPVNPLQVALEAFCDEVDFQKLEGLWRLIYTTALDVVRRSPIRPVPLVRAPSIPFPLPVQIGNIYQQFSSPEVGEVRNIIKLSVPLLLEPGGPSASQHTISRASGSDLYCSPCSWLYWTLSCWRQSSGDAGATFRVEARYSIESPRRIALRFQAGGISNVNISSFTETLIAPALVGRNFISHQLLLALQEFVGDFILCHLQLNIRIPLPTASNLRQGTAVGQFLLSYLDDDMLIGRAENGTFIFERGS